MSHSQRHAARRSRRLLVYEHHSEPLLPMSEFASRLAVHAGWSAAVVLAGLGLGVAGYHFLARLPWVDAVLNAAMILGGMGPVDPLTTSAAKLFAAVYALFAGVLFIGVTGLLLAPLLHRLLHRLHLEETDPDR